MLTVVSSESDVLVIIVVPSASQINPWPPELVAGTGKWLSPHDMTIWSHVQGWQAVLHDISLDSSGGKTGRFALSEYCK